MVQGIPPDISYGLQCATELMDITGDVLTFYYMFNDDVSLADLVDNQPFRTDDIKESLRSTARLYYRPYNNWFFTKAQPEEKAWCVAGARDEFGRVAGEAIDYYLSHYVSDALKNNLDPSTKRYQEQWLDQSRAFTHVEKVSAMLAKKMAHTDTDDILAAIQSPGDFQLRLRPIQNPFNNETIGERLGLPDEAWIDFGSPKLLTKQTKKKQRKVLRRSSEFLRKLMGKDRTTLFIGGKEVTVEGERFIFSVKVNQIHGMHHGALDIRILEKTSGDYLCNLCWYVEKTPALDQMAAIIMAVQTGDEDTIIKIGNAFSVQNKAVEQHPHVHDLIAPRVNTPFAIESALFPQAGENRDIFDDRMLHFTEGTHNYLRYHQGVHQDFHRRCRDRILRHFPDYSRPHFALYRPQDMHNFLEDGSILRRGENHITPDQLVNEPTLETLLLP